MLEGRKISTLCSAFVSSEEELLLCFSKCTLDDFKYIGAFLSIDDSEKNTKKKLFTTKWTYLINTSVSKV